MNKLNKKFPFSLAIGLIVILSLIVAVISVYSSQTMPSLLEQNMNAKKNFVKKEEDKTEKNIDLTKSNPEEVMTCKADTDCGIRFDTCTCKTVCRNVKDFKYVDNCNKACKIEDSDLSTQDCQCKNNKCEKKAVDYFNLQ